MANLEALIETAAFTNEKMVDRVKVDATLVRHTTTTSDEETSTIARDDVRLLLAEQLAAILMAKENLTALQRRKHLFAIQSLHVPIGPNHFDVFVAKIWARMWPDRPYPRYEQLTSEQRYLCFGPETTKFKPTVRHSGPS